MRARVRAELTAEIMAAARNQLATQGAASLSLRAIARDLGMASSAIYRYFESREELLTALIVDAYDAVGEAVEAADAGCDRADHVGRFTAIGRALRTWALSNPHEYALIYGSPVPGYAAPDTTIDPATRVPVALLAILVDRYGQQAANAGAESAAGSLDESLAALAEFVDHSVAPEILARGVGSWAEILGLISLELFGHFNNTITDTDVFFEHALQQMVQRVLA